MLSRKFFTLILLLFFGMACSPSSKKPTPKQQINPKPKIVKPKKKALLIEEPTVILNEKNAIPFLFEYQKQALPSLVEISTSFGEITIELFDEAPYHKANFIYLARLVKDMFFSTCS